MSRLIVKNLPNGMKEDRFRKMFADFGTLTDCTLKFTKDGKFRKFGFIGFKTEEDAEKALKHLNKTFVDTSRVTVEFCTDFGDPNKARPWSKHTRQPSSNKVTEEPKSREQLENEESSLKQKKPLNVLLGDLEKDESFQEFLAVHQKRTQAPTWANDTVEAASFGAEKEKKEKKQKKAAVSDDYLNFDSDESEQLSEDEDAADEEDKQETDKKALKKDLSDMDYLRSKIVEKSDIVDKKEMEKGGHSASAADEDEDENENENEDEEKEEDEEESPVQQTDTAYESIDKTSSKNSTKPAAQNMMEPSTEFTVKLRGAPFSIKEQQVREFMMPLKPVAIRFGKNGDRRHSGYVYVDLQSEAEVERALRLHRDYMGGHYIEVFRANNLKNYRKSVKESKKEINFVSELRDDEEEEDVAESGRLFVRNLPYTCTEEDLKEVFIKLGPLSEMHFPIDSLTKKPKGFAFVTYMIPENAVSALAELDGHVFQGRVLHVIASRLKKENPDQGPNAPGSSSYKRKKDAKDKAASGSSHNWNTLFLGTSAVADAIAQKYNTTKSKVLDHESNGSLAVRMALGETQIVQETRQFLLDNGVSLDSFSQASGQRSNSVLLVKNLPSGVQVGELEALFSPHGSLGRVLLPPSGLTAIVEFLEPTEAKRAFMKLAYTKFQHVPLYLEWAPVAVFTTPPTPKPEPRTKDASAENNDSAKKEEEEEDEEEEEQILPGSTLFIKNLNFNTSEETLHEHCTVDEHQLELKISEREFKSGVADPKRKKQTARKQTTSKILVRNIPFQATVKELRELFCTFGELKTVRLPKKGIGGAHRGFGFIDFLTKQDAKKAFTALCHSTHLYGRRLVLEWADAEETVDDLRRKTAQHFHDAPKKRKKAEVLEGILEQMEVGDEDGE
ncbi:putative RNA-binding protein 19 [Anabarilius grahami]|uniref:Probable RNA-binding protein 19 n=1 Tax=Anabarilius grahami TaxID=495550 RepID=A0A3N0YXU5_ANAGA|nr:putative RNA-binding protein 19 [Anabarilius grahami]